MDSLHALAKAPVTGDTGDTGVRRATFALREAPYTLDANVELPPPPDSARLRINVRLDPIRIAARVRCEPPNGHGVRAASLTPSAPPWASVRFEQLEQSADVCNGRLSASRHDPRITFRPLVAGVGVVGGPGQPFRTGALVGIGFAIAR